MFYPAGLTSIFGQYLKLMYVPISIKNINKVINTINKIFEYELSN